MNVGPMPDGRFEAAAIRRLREMGCWMDVNGESIYGTAASTLPTQSFGKVTMRKEKAHTTFYLHLWDISPDADIFVEGIEAKRVEAHVLESGQPVKTTITAGGIRLSLPKDIAGLNMPVIKVESYQDGGDLS